MGRPLPSPSEPCRRHRPPGCQPEFPQPRFAGRRLPRHRKPDPFHPQRRRIRRLRGHPPAGRLRQRCHPREYHGTPFHDRSHRCGTLLFRRKRRGPFRHERRQPFLRFRGEPFLGLRLHRPRFRVFREPFLRFLRGQELLFPQRQLGELPSVHFLFPQQRLFFRKLQPFFRPVLLFGLLPQQRRQLFGRLVFP